VIARLYNVEKTSPYGYPKAKTRMSLQTSSTPASGKSNEIRMEDGGGAMEFFMNASKDYDAYVNHDKTETVGVDEGIEVGTDVQTTVGGDQTIQVGANLSSTVSSEQGLHVGGSRTKKVGGSETITVAGDIQETVEANDTETVGGSHTT